MPFAEGASVHARPQKTAPSDKGTEMQLATGRIVARVVGIYGDANRHRDCVSSDAVQYMSRAIGNRAMVRAVIAWGDRQWMSGHALRMLCRRDRNTGRSRRAAERHHGER
jgi:hypothetical protein